MRDINDISERHAEVNGLNFREATALSQIETISRLAGEVWRHHYMPIIGSKQVEYMLDRFQSVDAIDSQIEAGLLYYLMLRGNQPLAYFAVLPSTEQKSLHISKLYVDPSQQHKGLGKRTLAFIEHQCRRRDLDQLWLTVNRHNHAAIGFYLRNGFVNTGSLVQDIGAGFVMDDFRMDKSLC
ncbi:GNAT family N-acetyltransferase [Methylomonas sp. LL1]|uniref:GNAT family N-acetyltransferase n=1 Tax=Methylomonas sp. LL1 TaxID=2785785 RepID=UPI0018C3D30F|nr:GNAT family N-acetyltransferase [Methylomonas sp. LL1]QPK65133.1 GNAT family N-acetyltransferase [Methylomonas sp. LL1]